MKKLLIKSVIALAALFPGVASAQVNYNRQGPLSDKSFSMVLLGDPQNYTKFDYNQPMFDLMMAWTAHHLDTLNVKAVLCTGDLVDQNDNIVPPFPRFGNLPSDLQWEYISGAFKRIDNKVPYLISTGNHDYGHLRSENSITRFPDFFNIGRNYDQWRNTLVATAISRNGRHTLENAAMEVKDPNWGKLLVLALEFAPRDTILSWAGKLVNSDRFKDHKVVVLTHSYLTGFDSKRIKKEGYKMQDVNAGEQIWQKLVYPSKNIVMVLCGHYACPNEKYEYTTGFRTDKNSAGRDVHQMMFNCQALGGGMSGNGGEGFLRLLEFMPDGKTVEVRTYSPLFGASAQTKHLAWRNAPYDRFSFVIK